jgi:DNA-binding NtrC family response regulator
MLRIFSFFMGKVQALALRLQLVNTLAACEDMTMYQQIVIVDDASERTTLLAQALRDSGYGVTTLTVQNNEELQAGLCRLQPDFLVIGDEVVIDLKADDGMHMLQEISIAC